MAVEECEGGVRLRTSSERGILREPWHKTILTGMVFAIVLLARSQGTLSSNEAMRLSEFIRTHDEEILSEWEGFARTIGPAGGMDIAALRDHAHEMLTVIAQDLETPQTEGKAADKSRGLSDAKEGPDTPAQSHGSGRAESGFTFEQMVSEYRALRASVIRLWAEKKKQLQASDITDMIRFNEAIDQALAESTSRYVGDLDFTKDTWLGILGHDLRTPLGAIVTGAQFIMETTPLPPPADTLLPRILSSGERMTQMIDDLLDFTRSRLGASIPIARTAVDLGPVISDAVDEIQASAPDATLKVEKSGDLRGEWDGPRLSQVLSNLLSNAVHHGSRGTPITVTVRGEAEKVVFSVHNQGPPIPRNQLGRIFHPLSRTATASLDPHHLGLGLYIAERVVTGHGGTIEVASTEEQGTTFTVTLPRRPLLGPP